MFCWRFYSHLKAFLRNSVLYLCPCRGCHRIGLNPFFPPPFGVPTPALDPRVAAQNLKILADLNWYPFASRDGMTHEDSN